MLITYASDHEHSTSAAQHARRLLEHNGVASSIEVMNNVAEVSTLTKEPVLFIIPSYKEVPSTAQTLFEFLKQHQNTDHLKKVNYAIAAFGSSEYMGEHGEDYQRLGRELEFLLDSAGAHKVAAKAELDVKDEKAAMSQFDQFITMIATAIKK
ncbi:hypothetical protein P9112_011208 [Eukaryota sp. TZLM1-RC]